MPFVSPLALVGLAFVPLVLAFYMLKLRRDEKVVPSTLLWTRLVADIEANAPWQRLRRSVLLLLQLLLVALLALLAARPFLDRPASLARDLVIVVDDSASMGATDTTPAQPNRLAAAKQAAIDALADLPTGGTVSVIAAGRTARVVANGTADLGRVRQAIGSIELTDDVGDLGDALRLASALAARSGDAEVLVATDAALAAAPTATVRAPVHVLRVGRQGRNQAIVALAVRTSPSSVTRSVFVSVANSDTAEATRRVELWGDGRLLEARELFLDPQARADVSIDDLPASVGVVEVRLTAAGSSADAGGTTGPDELAVDDRAWAIVPPDRTRNILLVSNGDPYLETALSYLPNTTLWGLTPDRYPAGATRTDGTGWDLVIFEGQVPVQLPPAPVLAIAPTASNPLGDVTGTLTDPAFGPANPDEPLLRYVDLSTVHVATASRLVLPEWARSVIPGPAGAPLLYGGVRAGRASAVLAFEPRDSDLPLQTAFPILVSNLVGELLGASAAPADAVSPGNPVTLAIPVGATGVRVTRPDGSSVDLAAPLPGAGSVQFSGTDGVGVYTVEPIGQARGTSRSDSPAGLASGHSGASRASPLSADASSSLDSSVVLGANASGPVRFAVDLFDVHESSILPGSASAIEALGSAFASPAPSATTGGGATGGGTPGGAAGGGTSELGPQRPPARDELWGPLLVLVLVALAVEWAVYERDALVRLRRGVIALLRRPETGQRASPFARGERRR